MLLIVAAAGFHLPVGSEAVVMVFQLPAPTNISVECRGTVE